MDTYTLIVAILVAMEPTRQNGIGHGKPFAFTFARALEQRFAQALPQTVPDLSDIPLRELLATATVLRAIAGEMGVRDDFDRAMDDVYQQAYAAERRRRWGDKFAA